MKSVKNEPGFKEFEELYIQVRKTLVATIELLEARDEDVNAAMMLGTITQVTCHIIETVIQDVIRERGES